MGCLVASQTIVDDFLPYLLMQEIDNENADLGCFVDGNGDKLILMDATGNIIRDDRLFMLTSYILFDKTPGFELLAPQHMTSKLELLAASNHGLVRRTKTGTNSQMKALIEKDASLENSLQYWLQYDAIASLAYIIEYLCQDRSTLSEVMNQIPYYRVESSTIHCPWESMGKVMRLLIKESDGQNLNLTEGVKIYDSESWALILPGAEQPILQIFAEGKNIRETRNILKRYTLLIENYIESGA
jgi:mannose-1-phosphate guanylyltransferase/phosphomannomutase